MNATCEFCGAAYSRAPSRRGRFCSSACRHDALAAEARRRAVSRLTNLINAGDRTKCIEWAGATCGRGYGQVYTSKRLGLVTAHRLAYELFNGGLHGLHVLHSCDNPPCCNPAHLFLGTNLENMNDCKAKGRRPRGESHSCAKLTEAQARRIKSGSEPASKLASELGVAPRTVRRVRAGETWAHVP